jgi:DNA-binding winged helix-turn-helix (wHTH) protein
MSIRVMKAQHNGQAIEPARRRSLFDTSENTHVFAENRQCIMTGTLGATYEFGEYRLDMAEYRLFHEGEEIKLRKKVMDFLLALVKCPGQLLTKDRLLDEVWGETQVAESNLPVCVKELREALGPRYIETVAGRGYRFTAQVRLVEQPATNAGGASGMLHNDRPPTGALSPDSTFYVKRETHNQLCAAVTRSDTLVLVEGSRQVGKTSLLAHGIQYARELGRTIVVTDFQSLNVEAFSSIDGLLYALAERIAYQLELSFPSPAWRSGVSPNMNFENYMRTEVLPRAKKELFWCMDEVDRLSNCAYKNDFFGLLRSWHNFRWAPFTIVLAYAAEAHLLIPDLNQSPFNVGTRVALNDFTVADVAELDRRYGSPLGDAVGEYCKLLGGHPYLVHYGLYKMTHDKLALASLQAHADHPDGPFGDHLHRVLSPLFHQEGLSQAVRTILRGEPGLSSSDFYRLRSAGILTGDSPHNAALRCELYSIYLKKHLL